MMWVTVISCGMGWLAVSAFNVSHTSAQSAPKVKVLSAEKGPITPLVTKSDKMTPTQEADLAFGVVGFADDGRVIYVVQNRGRTAANSPFVVDILVDGVRKDTVKHDPLPPMSAQRVHSTLARPDACGKVTIRVVADSQSLVDEHDETNNNLDRDAVPPCPDLVVKITKDSVNNNLEYRARVRVTNEGNLSTGRSFHVLLKGASGGGTGIGAMPVLKRKLIDPLASGASKTFYESGKHWGTTGMHYFALADQLEVITEASEENNDDEESMGP
ncbi:MAG: CARDB domain-containing protein [Nitrospiria bacterium]